VDSIWPRYSVQIDEEGYPHFDGLRVNDGPLLKTLLDGIRRRNPALPASALVTTCEDEVCWVDAFDAPWVARAVEKRADGGWDWIMPGEVRRAVDVNRLEVDAWHRIHAWIGDEKIPAVLSRAAQAAFLHSVENLKSLALRPFRAAREPVNGASFWSEAYRTKQDGWELGRPTALLEAHVAIIKTLLPAGDVVWVPGAGRGHEVHWAEQQGWRVTGLDFAPEAERGFREIYPASRAAYLTDDAFATLAKAPGTVAGVLEHTFFCALDPERRKAWLESVWQALKPGGIYFGVFYLKAAPGGPPFGLTGWELREQTKDHFDILAWERAFERPVAEPAGSSRAGQELFAILRKR